MAFTEDKSVEENFPRMYAVCKVYDGWLDKAMEIVLRSLKTSETNAMTDAHIYSQFLTDLMDEIQKVKARGK